MQRVFLWLVFSLFTLPGLAQKQVNTWYFGNKLGLDFNTLPPQVLYDGEISPDLSGDSESAAVMSDAEGQLLFYTDGVTVWNSLHQRMRSGTDLWGSGTTTQTLIVPRPGYPKLFYVFTASPKGDGDSIHFPAARRGFCYSVVDLALENGLGDVTEKNTLLVNSTTERMTATLHANGEDIWVVMHEWRSNAFRAYRINRQGIDPKPVISLVGLPHTGQVSGNAVGQMKISPDGQLLAVAITVQRIVQVFRFDPMSGTLILTGTLSDFDDWVYGIEFSPNSRFLYVSAEDITQFDLQAPDISQKRVTLSSSQLSNDAAQLQLAPDGKVYAARHSQAFLGIIQQPNQAGQASGYEPEAVMLRAGSICNSGLPNFLSSYLAPVEPVLEMPNVITPNGDADNPSFRPIRSNFIRKGTVQVYNRWGAMIYETDALEKGWDGSNYPTGIYYWSVDYQGINEKSYFQKGLLQLLR